MVRCQDFFIARGGVVGDLSGFKLLVSSFTNQVAQTDRNGCIFKQGEFFQFITGTRQRTCFESSRSVSDWTSNPF